MAWAVGHHEGYLSSQDQPTCSSVRQYNAADLRRILKRCFCFFRKNKKNGGERQSLVVMACCVFQLFYQHGGERQSIGGTACCVKICGDRKRDRLKTGNKNKEKLYQSRFGSVWIRRSPLCGNCRNDASNSRATRFRPLHYSIRIHFLRG